MTPEQTREQIIAAETVTLANAATAQQLLDSEFVRNVLSGMEKAAIAALCEATTDDERRTAQAEVICTRKFAQALVAAVESGKLSAHQRNTREKAEAAAPRRAPTRK